MTLTLDLGPDLEAKLRERAAAAGKDPEAFALQALAEKLRAPRTFAEILAPAHKSVVESGMTEDEVQAFLLKAITDARRERRERG
jgi:hypothetical protein